MVGTTLGVLSFPFESKNGWIRRHVHGSVNIMRYAMRMMNAHLLIVKQAVDVQLPEEEKLLKQVLGHR